MMGTARIFVNHNHLTLRAWLAVDKHEMTVSGQWAHLPSDEDIDVWGEYEAAVFSDMIRRLRKADGAGLN